MHDLTTDPAPVNVATALLGSPMATPPPVAAMPPATAPPAPAPIVAGAAAVMVTSEELAQSKRDLLWVLLVGCVPLAVTFYWFDRNPETLSGLSRVGRSALGNAVASLELLLCLKLVHRGRNDLRDLWGGTRRALLHALAAVALGGLLFAVWWSVFHLIHRGTIPSLLPKGAHSTIGATDWSIFGLTTFVAAGATGLTIYGVVLKQFTTLLQSRAVAVLVAATIATLVWNLAATPAQLGAEIIRQLMLATAVVFAGRVWPVSLASATCTILIWLRGSLQ